jgi:hypothetical protein
LVRPLLVGVSILLPSAVLVAQPGVRAALEKEGVDWVVGNWKGANEAGQQISLVYEWTLNGSALEIDLTLEGAEYEGIIVREPLDGKLTELGADNRGGVTRATWRVDDGALVSERRNTSAEGQEYRMAVVSRKVDDDTVIATVHRLTESGEVSDEVRDTVKLTRQDADADAED